MSRGRLKAAWAQTSLVAWAVLKAAGAEVDVADLDPTTERVLLKPSEARRMRTSPEDAE
ncbi:MAG: hypothetical protein AAF532_03500 [Planctomycetota bacterium]